MIEVPAAAMMADVFAAEADFMSIGTNDLVQYALAIDRTNRALAYLASPYDPAILRLIRLLLGRLYDFLLVAPDEGEGKAALIARLKDPTQRQRIEKEIKQGLPGWYNHYTATGSWEGMLLVSLSNPEYKRFEGKRMNEVIAAVGGDPIAGQRSSRT